MGNKSKDPPESGPDHPKDEVYLNTVISKRIAIFESIKSELSGDLIKITLPDGSVKKGKKWILTPLDIAKEISKSLAANALISKVNGVLWDMSRPPDRLKETEYIARLEEAKKNDHRELGKNQELFFFHPLSYSCQAMLLLCEICVFLPHGARIYNKLVEFIRNPYWNRVYQEVVTLNIYNMQLWETSGHAANYRENMFLLDIEKQEFALKPMNCPGHCLIFDHRVRSYGGIIVFYKEIINKVLDPAENFTNPTSFTRGEAPRSLNNRTPALHKSL